MIPKLIHYCWYGRGEKPELAQKCIDSWKKYCPDYQIIEWNEDNTDIASCPKFVREAMNKKIYAFVSDYVRYEVVYEHGGIYLDTDVELLKSLDPFLQNSAYFGFFKKEKVASGVGFGAEKGLSFLRELMEIYEHEELVKDGAICFDANTNREKAVFLRHGLMSNGETQTLDNGVRIYAETYFSPYDTVNKKMVNKTEQTVSIHWGGASWHNKILEAINKKNKRREITGLFALPLKAVKLVLGEEKYRWIREKILKRFT